MHQTPNSQGIVFLEEKMWFVQRPNDWMQETQICSSNIPYLNKFVITGFMNFASVQYSLLYFDYYLNGKSRLVIYSLP